MTPKNRNRDASYEDMARPLPTLPDGCESPYYDPPAKNEFEKAKWNSNGYDQAGMK